MKNLFIAGLIIMLGIFIHHLKKAQVKASYEYHIELLDQKMIKVCNNDTILIMHRDSLDNYFIKDNE